MEALGLILYLIQQVMNLLTYYCLCEAYFPLTLTLSPLGERGKEGTDLMIYSGAGFRPAVPLTLSPPTAGGEGWGEGGDI